MTSLFVQNRQLLEVEGRRGQVLFRRHLDRGLSEQRREGSSQVHRWRALPEEEAPPADLPAAARDGVTTALAPWPSNGEAELREALEQIEALTRGLAPQDGWLEVMVRQTREVLAVGPPESLHVEVRGGVQLRLRGCVPEGAGPPLKAEHERAYPHLAAALADLPGIAARAQEVLGRAESKRARTPCPAGSLTVVIPPGADAGVLFHELCGHPLEGDVVLRQASYLARRQGERIAPGFLTVTDDPTGAPGACTYGVDDEGSLAAAVPLIGEGRVQGPLLDRRTAEALGLRPNGHGRRASYRHFPLPRMAHTRVMPHKGRLEELVSEVEDGLLVGFLTPRHVNLLSGEFSFFIVEARRIRRGRLEEQVGPGLFRGDGLGLLARVDAVGEEDGSFFGLKGCGKLDQGGLPVSFGNPAVRIASVRVEPWR